MRRLVRQGPDEGSVALETAILIPALALLVAVIVAAGRITMAGGAVDAAAKAASREASLARTPQDAAARADAAARRTLEQRGLSCASMSVNIDTTEFAPPAGGPARVRATVRCTVSLSDAGVPGMPGSKTMESTMISPVDKYRDRSLAPPASAGAPTTPGQL